MALDLLDIVQSFLLLSYRIVSPIYISPICNVENYYSEKIKLGILYFSLFTWYQSQERKPNFLGDRVSFRLPFPSPDLLLTTASAAAVAVRRRPPPSLPPATSRGALLRPKPTYFEAQRADLHAGGLPAGIRPPTRRHARVFSGSLAVHAPARECACGRVAPSPVTRLHCQDRPAPSWCSSPPAVHSEHFFSTFCPFRRRRQLLLLCLPPPSLQLFFSRFSWLQFFFSRFSWLQFFFSRFSWLQFFFSRILYGLSSIQTWFNLQFSGYGN